MPNKRRTVNPIDVVETAYDLEASRDAWLEQLGELVRPLLDRGHGLLAYTFDIREPIQDWFTRAVKFEIDRTSLPFIIRAVEEHATVTTKIHLGYEGLLTTNDVLNGIGGVSALPALEAYYRHLGIVDYATLQTIEPGGKGVVFCAGQPTMRSFDRRTRQLWARVNVHIAAARRLREVIATAAPTAHVDGVCPGGIEAVMTPSGKVEHAEGETKTASAREALRTAVLRQEQARGRARREDPEGATEAWTAMVSGRWSLVDRFERGGRRYVVARRNEHTLPDPRALTRRERAIAHLAALGKPNKLIAYELGLAESTVGSHLSTAMRKLGVSTRIELITLVMQLSLPKPQAQ